MSIVQYTVTRNGTTTILTQVRGNSLIKNLDPVNTVWIAPETSVQSGSGYKLGPYASVQWTTHGPLYAALDAAATSSVQVAVSDNLDNPSDPVNVGAAVAVEIASQGIPSVFLSDQLISNLTMIPLGTYGYYDVSRYSSLNLATAFTIAAPGNWANLQLTFYDDSKLVTLGVVRIGAVRSNVSAVPPMNTAISVVGTRMRIDYVTNDNTSSCVASLAGTNRATGYVATRDPGMGIVNFDTGNFGFTTGAYIDLGYLSGMQGRCTYELGVLGATLNGTFQLQDSVGTQMDFADTATFGTGSDGFKRLISSLEVGPNTYRVIFTPLSTASSRVFARFTTSNLGL